jgi:hypothetical protein
VPVVVLGAVVVMVAVAVAKTAAVHVAASGITTPTCSDIKGATVGV